jgi:hypothetical protein
MCSLSRTATCSSASPGSTAAADPDADPDSVAVPDADPDSVAVPDPDADPEAGPDPDPLPDTLPEPPSSMVRTPVPSSPPHAVASSIAAVIAIAVYRRIAVSPRRVW